MDAERKVKEFYESFGWRAGDGSPDTEDALRFEDLRPAARAYVGKCRLRLLRFIPPSGENLLDMASGPIQYPEYLEFSKGYKKRYCVDLSARALEGARSKIGDHGVFLCGSFLDMDLEESFFDCTISLHTIYHIDKDRQEEAVRKLLRVTKPGSPVIIVYSNPDLLIRRLFAPVRLLKRLLRRRPPTAPAGEQTPVPELYFFEHPLRWWRRFRDVADVSIHPWRSFAADHQRRLFPDSRLGSWLLRGLFFMEDRFPAFFARNFQYPVIVLRKRKG